MKTIIEASKVSRDYAFEIGGRDGLNFDSFWRKTYNYKLSEQVLKKLIIVVVQIKHGHPMKFYQVQLINVVKISLKNIKRLIETYGSKVSKLNEYYNEFNEWNLIFDDFYEFEVKYLNKGNGSNFWRYFIGRTKLGINFPKEARIN